MRNDLPRYSAVMSVYSGEKAENLSASLQSMFSQTCPCDELILVCDGELTPELDSVIAGYSAEYGSRLRVIRSRHHVGVGACANEAVRAARTGLIAKMDSDDIALPDRCEKQLAFMADNPDTDILGGYIEEFDDATGETVALRRTPLTHDEIARYARRRSPFNNQTLMLRRSAVIDAGWYDTVGRCEDYDLAVRMLQNGAKAANLPEILVRYRVSAGNLERRRDLRNTLDFIAVRRKIHRSGFSSLADLLIPCAAQIALFILPSKLTGKLYKKFLRG